MRLIDADLFEYRLCNDPRSELSIHEIDLILRELDKEPTVCAPVKIGHGYKLLEQNTRTGDLFPLFIGKNKPTATGVWIMAEDIPTKGYAHRPGWHIGLEYPFAAQLLDSTGKYASRRGKDYRRVWCEVSYPMDVDYQEELERNGQKDMKDRIPVNGCYTFNETNGKWIIAGAIRIDRILSDDEVASILEKCGIDFEVMARAHVRKRFKKELGA